MTVMMVDAVIAMTAVILIAGTISTVMCVIEYFEERL